MTWRRLLVCFAGPLLALVLSASALHAAPVGIFEISTLAVSPVAGVRTDGNRFSFDFDLTSLVMSTSQPFVSGASSFGYLNLVVGSEWVLQNEPIPLIDGVLTEDNHFWFASPIDDFANAAAILNDMPFGSPPVVDALWSPVGPGASFDWGSEDPAGGADEGDPGPAVPPPAVPVIEGYLRGGVPDLDQLRNECGPTSVTNSLLWLIKKYGLPTDKLPKKPNGDLDEQAILKLLAKAINPAWDDTQPIVDRDRGYTAVTSTQMIAGKKKFAADTGLKLKIHGGWDDADAKGANTFGFIKSELKRKQDVELSVTWTGGGAHWVTVVGYVDAGPDKKTLIVHDPDDKKTGNVYWKLKDDGSFTSIQAKTQVAVAESVPEPGAFLLMLVGAGMLAGRRVSQRRGGC
jgi:hypothetical protein